MRLLFIALRPPVPARSGNAVVLGNYLRYLSRHHEIDLVAFGDPRSDPPALDRWCSRVELVHAPGVFRSRAARVYGLVAGVPSAVSGYRSSHMHRAVERLVGERAYDAIVVQLCEAAQYKPVDFDGPVLLDLEDPPSVKLARTLPHLPLRRKAVALIDHSRLVRYEAGCAVRFDRLVFVSRLDAQEFGSRYGCLDKVRWIPHGVDVQPDSVPGFEDRVSGMVVVSGNMNHPPNVAGVDFLCDHVFARVRAAVPDATLWIVGANPSKRVLDRARDSWIKVTGTVPDIREYLMRARVAACGVPVVVGTQTKVLEALACATPVVTTSAGNHGIEAADGDELFVADDAAVFADRIISLLKGEKWNALSQAGHRLARERFNADQPGAALERVIREAVADNSARPHTPRKADARRGAGIEIDS